MRRLLGASAILATVLALPSAAFAFVDIGFTPIDLVKDSDVIMLLELTQVDGQNVVHAKVAKVVKGELPAKEITVNLAASELSKVAGKKLEGFMKQGQKQALLFVGRFEFHLGTDDGGGRPEVVGFLHMAGQWTDNSQNEWFVLERTADGNNTKWGVRKCDSELLGVWNGGTDMLLRCVEYILSTEKAILPCLVNATWAQESLVAKVSGRVFAAKAVDLTGRNANGRADLFIAADPGDRLFRYADGKMVDITAACQLKSMSRAFAWGDFDGNGTLDLASHDGTSLTLHRQQADGTFVAAVCDTGEALADAVEFSTLDVGEKGRAAVLVTGRRRLQILTFAADGRAMMREVSPRPFPADTVAPAQHSLVADLDADGLADVLVLGTRGGLFYKGQAPGAFAEPVPTAAACGTGMSSAALGDFDADGLLDVFTVAEDRNRLWQNLGGGKFVNMLVASGTVFYYPKSGGVAVDVGDFNNDGLADVQIVYGIANKPHPFFNRGFRSFGEAYSLDLLELDRLDAARDGQQAGCLADFTGDGALDMLLVLKKDGEVWLFPRQVDEKTPGRAVIAALPLGGATAGPVNVCAWAGKRPLGAQVVRAGEPGAFFGATQPGPVTLKWKAPDGKEHEKTVQVQNGPVRVTLDDGK
jgi:hypothetical protein